jgi:hypothetical protein
VFDCCVDLYQSLQGFFVKTAQPIKLTHADILYKLYWTVHSRMEISQKSTLAALSCRHPVEFVLDYTYGVVGKKRVPNHDEDALDNQRQSGRPQRTVKAPQVFTFTSPNNNDSSSPSKPSAKKKRKKRKKPSERSAQENLEAMRESRARNLPPSSEANCSHFVISL